MVEKNGKMPWDTSGRKSVKEDFKIRFSSTIISKIFGFARSFILPKILEPKFFGIWSLINIFLNYSNLSNLWVLSEVNRRLPQLEVQNKSKEYIITRSIGFWFGILTSTILSFITFLFLFLNKDKDDILNINFLFILIVVSIIYFQQILNYQKTNMRSLGKIGALSSQEIIFSVSLLILNTLGAFYFNIIGLLISTSFTYLISLLFYTKHNPIDKLIFNSKKIFNILKHAFPLLLMAILSIIMRSAPQIIIAKKFTLEDVGYFSFGILFSTIIYTIPTSLVGVMSPRYRREYGRTFDSKQIVLMFMKSFQIISIISPIIVAAIMISVDFVVFHFLDKYIASIHITQILLVGMSFFSISLIFGDPLVAMHKQNNIIKVYLIIIPILISAILVSINLGYGLKGVVIITVLGNILYCLLIGSAFILSTNNSKDSWMTFAKVILNTIYILAVTISIIVFLPFNNLSIYGDIQRIGLRFLILIIFISPLIIHLYKKNQKYFI